MKKRHTKQSSSGLGTAPVYFTAISTILGAILFLRFGFAVGTLGFWGAVGVIILGHLITIPTAMAVSEIATNKRVEGGGEYFIISRSFGQKIGTTIGIVLYFSQVISIAFYIIAFAEAFTPFFNWFQQSYGFELPRQVVSVPAVLILSFILLRKGINSGLTILYVVCVLLLIALGMFFIGDAVPSLSDPLQEPGNNFTFMNSDKFFLVLAICFPAFTGMTAGVGLSGDLKNPAKSLPMGTMGGTLTGLLVYLLIVWKLADSASQADLVADQLIMSRIAVAGSIVIPIGLAACTFTSALGSILVAPRTLHAIASDGTIPLRRFNAVFSRVKGNNKEPFNATLVSSIIALMFVIMGNIDMVAEIITMFYLMTYGSLCLISFLNHFGSSPSYRPRFKSKWYLSLGGFLLSIWTMFMINSFYTIVAIIIIAIIYIVLEHYNKDKKGFASLLNNSLFQLSRHLRVFLQKDLTRTANSEWRPSAICISPNSFERDKVLILMKWLSHQHGFGTYFHFIQDFYNQESHNNAQEIREQLLTLRKGDKTALYMDTMISPSYTSAIAQVIQAPSISGMDNNMVVFEYDKQHPEELTRIMSNIELVKAGNFDICIFAASTYPIRNHNNIHVWIESSGDKESNLMILLGYIIMAHPDWKKSQIKIFTFAKKGQEETIKQKFQERVTAGRLPITINNIEIVILQEDQSFEDAVHIHSKFAGLTFIGFPDNVVETEGEAYFHRFEGLGDVLFVNSSGYKEIE